MKLDLILMAGLGYLLLKGKSPAQQQIDAGAQPGTFQEPNPNNPQSTWTGTTPFTTVKGINYIDPTTKQAYGTYSNVQGQTFSGKIPDTASFIAPLTTTIRQPVIIPSPSPILKKSTDAVVTASPSQITVTSSTVGATVSVPILGKTSSGTPVYSNAGAGTTTNEAQAVNNALRVAKGLPPI